MKGLANRRQKQFRELKARIKATPLVDLGKSGLRIPNGNRILAKVEYDRNCHPTGSHYDRVFLRLIELHEKGLAKTPSGKPLPPITPKDTHLIEVSTGNAGAAFAWAGNQLEYATTVIVPDGLPKKRLDDARKNGANIEIAERRNYLNGAIGRLKELLGTEDKTGKRYVSINHPFHFETTLEMARIVGETFEEENGIDVVIFAIGNGSSLLGPAIEFKKRNDDGLVIGWEPFSSGMTFDKFCRTNQTPNYEQRFGVGIGFADHTLIGANGNGAPISFAEIAIERGLLDEIQLVSDDEQYQAYLSMIKENGFNGLLLLDSVINMVSNLPEWKSTQKLLHELGFPVGRTSAASTAVALELADGRSNRKLKDKTILVIFYDSIEKY